MSAGAAAASSAAISGRSLKGKDPDWKAFVYFILIISGAMGIILLIAWYAGNI